jgi:hypothetical protein
VDSGVPDDLLGELARIKGVLSVRYLGQR